MFLAAVQRERSCLGPCDGVDILPRGVSLCGLSPGGDVRMWHGTEGFGKRLGMLYSVDLRGGQWGWGWGWGRSSLLGARSRRAERALEEEQGRGPSSLFRLHSPLGEGSFSL